MKQAYVYIIFIITIITSCTKESKEIPLEIIPYSPNYKIFIEETNEESIKTVYKYSALWRVTEYLTYDNDIPQERNSFEYNNNLVTKTSNKNNTIYKYYLNKKRLADSIMINKIGLFNITETFKYDINGYVIKKNIVGLINNVPYEEFTDYIIENGNIKKSIQTSETDVFTTDFEYYTDSTNVLAGTNEALSFLPQNKNLLKKESFSDDTFNIYSYSIDNEGNLVISITNEFDETKQRIVKLININ